MKIKSTAFIENVHFCIIINDFTVILDLLNASSLNTNINFLIK